MGGGLTTLAECFSNSKSTIIKAFTEANVAVQIITCIMTFVDSLVGSALTRDADGVIAGANAITRKLGR